jgi:selenocysteine lyase/cysteine desulfurase
MAAIRQYEQELSRRFIAELGDLPGVRIHGITDGNPLLRTPTFAVAVEGYHPDEVAEELGKQGIFVWSGDYYAVEIMRALGLAEAGGLVRIGFVHYNVLEEVDRVVTALASL